MEWISVKDRLPCRPGRYLTFSWNQFVIPRTFMLLFFRERKENERDEDPWMGKDCEFEVAYWLDGDLEALLKEKLSKEPPIQE